MSSSIHVPASVVQRIVAIAKWVMPMLATGITAVGAMGWGWIASRTSMNEVAPKIAEVGLSAKAAQSSSFACDERSKMSHALAIETAQLSLSAWAVSEVDRQYSRSPNRSEYIQRAREFYKEAFERYLEKYPNDPAKALVRARDAGWRPDRKVD